jgi:N-acetylneuraminate synthase
MTNKIFFIAEIGINHNGSIKTALRLIRECKAAGVNLVKFQKRTPAICVPLDQRNQKRQTPWGILTYYDYKNKIEFEKKHYDIIDRYCKKIGILWTASVWDIPSFNFIQNYNVPFVKIPSALITNVKLLEEVAMFATCPVIISVGMSTINEVDRAVSILSDKLYAILHCNSSYPSKYNEIDIRVIETLKLKYPNLTIGYSGHEKDILPSIVAASFGAEIIERHVTLNKNMWGTDHSASLDITELNLLLQTLQNIEIILGKKELTVYPSETAAMQRLRIDSNFLVNTESGAHGT